MKMGRVSKFTTKIAACLVILTCLALGAIGMVLPIVPGLLFLAIGALMAARHSRAIDRLLRKNPTVNAYLDDAHGLFELSLRNKIQYGGLLSVKLLIDSTAYLIALASRLARMTARTLQRYR